MREERTGGEEPLSPFFITSSFLSRQLFHPLVGPTTIQRLWFSSVKTIPLLLFQSTFSSKFM